MISETSIVTPAAFQYETVGASATDQVLGVVGAARDRLERLIITVNTAATATVSIKDGGGSAITLITGAAALPVGVYEINVQAYSNAGAWSVTTGAGATVLAIGNFTNA